MKSVKYLLYSKCLVFCEEVEPNTCCRDDDQCITDGNVQCDRQDICVADILPGGGGKARCLDAFESERAAGIIIYSLLLLYLFLALAIICDDYFVPCLEKISDALDLSEDVAGATFMAAGSSAPELFVSMADNVFTNPPQNLGTGAVVGGGIFNAMVIIGLSAIFAGRSLDLNWRPFARDFIFYIFSVGLLVLFVSDSKVTFYEGLILFLFYGFYVLFMFFNARFFLWLDTKLGKVQIVDDKVIVEKEKPEGADAEENKEEEGGVEQITREEALRRYSSVSNVKSVKLQPNESGDYFDMFYWPESNKARVWYVLTMPINILFRFTVPDCTFDVFREDKEGKDENRKFAYSLAFTGCIIWIGLLSHILVYCTTVFGCLVGIDAAVMGLTLLAVGTNIPDALSSIIVARDGKGDMAVANSIGSNVFDILIGLGLPWFIAALAFDQDVDVEIDDLIVAVIFLVISLIFLLVVLVVRKWKLDFFVGCILLAFYFVYVIFELSITPLIIKDDEE